MIYAYALTLAATMLIFGSISDRIARRQGIVTRIGLGKLSPLDPPNRYERKRPGELIHIDGKKLGRIGPKGACHRATGSRQNRGRSRGAGWEFVHICIDDATRLAYLELLPDEHATTCIGFLKRALRYYRAHGAKVERPMTDNGNPYRSKPHAIACRALATERRGAPQRAPGTEEPGRFLHLGSPCTG